MTVGLTLGKFAPLHRGHQFLIETALRECDRVVTLIYPAPETTVPLSVRANWIRTLYPSVELIEAWDGPTIVGYEREVTALHDRYLTRLLAGRGITNFYSSEPYGEHVSRALGTIDRRVDQERRTFPITGTAIRRNPFVHRTLLDPVVYRDLVTRVVLVGAPSTGKTTLAEELARRYRTVWMPEYGREYWETHHVDRRLTLEQLVEIAVTHREREDMLALDADRFLFVDTEAIVTSLFSRYYHQSVHPDLQRLADLSTSRYDIFFLCGDDIPYADTPDRSGAANRELFHKWICDELAWRRVPYVTLQGSLEERIKRASRVLYRFEKYSSLADHLVR
jgi:HTH-type transcriptional repressor of NAD biosynthesis genes